MVIFTCAQKLTYSQLYAARNQTKKNNEETKNKNRDTQKKRSSHKAVESVLRPEGSLWCERFMKKVGLASCVAIGPERVLRVESVSQSSALSQMRSLTLATG